MLVKIGVGPEPPHQTLSLPATKEQVQQVHQKVKAALHEDYHHLQPAVQEIESKGFEELTPLLRGMKIMEPGTMGLLNELALVVGKWGSQQRDEYAILLKHLRPETVKEAITLASELYTYNILAECSMAKLGRYLMKERIVTYPPEVMEVVAPERVAEQFLQKNHEKMHSYGIVIKNGKCVPAKPEPQPWLYRLDFPNSAEPVLMPFDPDEDGPHSALGPINTWPQAKITCNVTELNKLVPQNDYHYLNLFALDYLSLDEKEQRESLAILEAVGGADSTRNAVMLLDDRGLFEVMPPDIDKVHYGSYVLYDSGRAGEDFELGEEVKDFIDYHAYTKYRMEEDGVRQTSRGLVRRIDEPFSPEQNDGIRMR